MIKQTISTKKVAGLGVAALLSAAMSTSALAVDFTATATVQNALIVTSVADMNLGTIFATTASTAAYRYITLAPDGTMGSSSGSATLTLLGLGGQAAAQASVAVGTNTAFTVTLPDAEVANATPLEATGAVAGSIAAIKATTDQVEVAAADPAVARFQLVNFTVGAVTAGTAAADCADITDDSNVCTLTPDFGATDVGFNIGATVVTDLNSAGAGDRDTYQPAAYTGTFTVTATY